jgi:hypothetical protein
MFRNNFGYGLDRLWNSLDYIYVVPYMEYGHGSGSRRYDGVMN